MEKKYLAKIIANDQEGLQMISACSAGAKVKVIDIKYWNKIGKIKEIFYADGRRVTQCFGCMCACLQKSDYKVPDNTYISHGHHKGHFNCHDKVVSKCPYH